MYFARRFPGFQLTASMTTFLYPVVKNTALACRRKRDRQVEGEHFLADPGSCDCNQHGEVREELASAMASLSAHEREIVLMRFVDGMMPQEIAVVLGIPLGTTKSRLSRALNRLREDPRMRDYFEG